jgi:hypothetical protein
MIYECFSTNGFVNPTCSYNPTKTIGNQNCTPFGIKYNLKGTFGSTARKILSGPALNFANSAVIKHNPAIPPGVIQRL